MKRHLVYRICIARVLRHTRRRTGYKQWTAAEDLGITQPAYSKYERGATPMPVDALAIVASHIEVDAAAVLERGIRIANVALEPESTLSEWATSPKILAAWCDETLSRWQKEEDAEEIEEIEDTENATEAA